MPRTSRRLSSSNVYHVMIRGNERKNIFLDDQDRERFLDILLSNNEEQAVRQFIEFPMKAEEDKFIDIPAEEDNIKPIRNTGEVRLYIEDFLKTRQLKDMDTVSNTRELRNELIRELKSKSALSVREIAGMLNIDRNIVQKLRRVREPSPDSLDFKFVTTTVYRL